MRNKYNAKKVEIDGIKFDSKREADYYQIYKEQEQNGIIKNLERQVPFIIQESYVNGEGKKIREIKYVADFVFEECATGKKHIVDVKGMILKEFKMKKKLFDKIYYPLYIEIVK